MFIESLHAELSIVEMKGRTVQSKSALVQVNRLSIKGLWFESELKFPLQPEMILHFRVFIQNETIDLRGTLIQSQPKGNLNVNLFEVIFIKDDLMLRRLKAMLSSLARQFIPYYRRAEYYYTYFTESSYNLRNSRINECL